MLLDVVSIGMCYQYCRLLSVFFYVVSIAVRCQCSHVLSLLSCYFQYCRMLTVLSYDVNTAVYLQNCRILSMIPDSVTGYILSILSYGVSIDASRNASVPLGKIASAMHRRCRKKQVIWTSRDVKIDRSH